MKNADTKRIQIIESAKRRFAHFGMAKTTMAEIAKDLSFSKALLYYYFPDKNSLFVAVLDYMIEELVVSTDKIISTNQSTEIILMKVLEERMRFVKDHYNIFEHINSMNMDFPPDIEAILPAVFEKEKLQIVKIFELGITRNEIQVDNIDETAKIFLLSLLGMRMAIAQEFKSLCIRPTVEEFDQILLVQKKLAKIFLNGLRCG